MYSRFSDIIRKVSPVFLLILLAAFLASCGNKQDYEDYSSEGGDRINYSRNIELVDSYNWDGKWKLVWEEGFTDPALDSDYWSIQEQGLNWNSEKQAYVKENVYIKEACLVLESKKEKWSGKANRNDKADEIVTQNYTSGEVSTKGKKSWKYGKFEMRAKLPKTKGILAAFWMTPENDSWPPEIDIAEMLGHNPEEIYFTNHYGNAKDHLTDRGVYKSDKDLSQDFHTYGAEWEPGIIKWYVDGEKRYETTKNVPDIPMYIRLSLPVGPDWEGDPDKSSVFPQMFSIDWVKVYQRK